MPAPSKSKAFSALFSLLGALILVYAVLHDLRLWPDQPDTPAISGRLAFFLFSFSIPMAVAWIPYKRWLAIPIGLLAVFVNTLALSVTSNRVFYAFYLFYVGFYLLLYWHESKGQSELLLDKVEIEKFQNDKNQLNVDLNRTAEELDASCAKYANYFGLREVASRFASTLSLDKIADMVIKETRNLIPKGDTYLLYLSDVEESSLSLIASFSNREEEKVKAKKGDSLDLLVLKNLPFVFIADTRREVQFDVGHLSDLGGVRSIMIVPVRNEGRVIGTLRINSDHPEIFNKADDLRLLGLVSDLASSAIANALLYKKTEELAIRDSLTNLYVQRYFKERLKEEHRRALLTNTPLSLLMCDLDRFKAYNDSYGHAAGDMILVKVGQLLSDEVKEEGIVARYGGEELAILLPRYAKEQAAGIAEKIRARVESEKVEVRREMTRITISIGISALPEDTLEREELIRKADQNLYVAKRAGRNRVVA